MKDNWVRLTVGQTIFRSCQFVGRNWELFVEFERVKSDERILNGWSLVKQGLVLVQTSLALLLDAQMQLRRWSSCSGGRRNAFPGWWMIQRLKFINSLAFLDVLAISRVYHQSLHHLDAAQTVEGGQHWRGWMHLQRLINDSNGIRLIPLQLQASCIHRVCPARFCPRLKAFGGNIFTILFKSVPNKATLKNNQHSDSNVLRSLSFDFCFRLGKTYLKEEVRWAQRSERDRK